MPRVRLNVLLFGPNINKVPSALFPWKTLELLQFRRDIVRQSRICWSIKISTVSHSTLDDATYPGGANLNSSSSLVYPTSPLTLVPPFATTKSAMEGVTEG